MGAVRYLSHLLFLAAALTLAGCSSDRSRVQGTVRYNGEPVDEGGIAFIPDGENASLNRATGPIQDGRYDLDGSGAPSPGKYRVEIYWDKKTGREIANRSRTAVKDERKQAIPAKYNENTELKVEVKPGRNTLDFDLQP